MKKRVQFIFIFFIFCTLLVHAQKKLSSKMGQTTLEELKMTVYAKDSTASAVVFYEHANRYPDDYNSETPRTDYYYRIKILDKSSFSLADISIKLFKKQQIKDISAKVYHLAESESVEITSLDEAAIFTLEKDENWVVKKFTLPALKEGVVIEYKYSIRSPYLQINDWNFQSDISKIESVFNIGILSTNIRPNFRRLCHLDKSFFY